MLAVLVNYSCSKMHLHLLVFLYVHVNKHKMLGPFRQEVF